jgi:heat shock protein HspQ
MSDWDVKCLSDGIKAARGFIGQTVEVQAKGFIAQGILLDVSPKFEATVQTPRNGIQRLAPLEKIDVIA